ncbi:glycogen synthase [Streptomyces sp. NPDC049099]|uniref:glycogen synthase n=1 Tax=Streptomyces sp. NPDC049099 TaxID=3155768 RepID=UPI0034447DAB
MPLDKAVEAVRTLALGSYVRRLPSGTGRSALPPDVEVQYLRLPSGGGEEELTHGAHLFVGDRLLVRITNRSAEREAADAVIAVSGAMREDVLACYPALDPAAVHVVHNGIDTRLYRPDHGTDALVRHGIDPTRPYVLFVGRITRQKGVPHLLRAVRDIDPGAQVVLCAGAPDTPEIDREFRELFEELSRVRTGVFWIPRMLPRPEVIQLLTRAAVFVCPSVYEPLGIVNLEAMACGTPVVASRVGGIPEVVDDGRTGVLVDVDEEFETRLARALDTVLGDPAVGRRMGEAGRERAVGEFGWDTVARRTAALYEEILKRA